MTSNQRIKTIIFDFGGVIINLDLPKCIQNFKNLGVHNVETYLSNFGQSGFFLQWEKGEIGIPEFRNEIRKIAEFPLSDEQIDQAWCSFLTDIPAHRIELLKKLRQQYRLLLLSNSNPLHVDVSAAGEFKKYGAHIYDFFDNCYFSYKIGMTKPDEEIFQYVMKDAGVIPEECLFIDDGKKNIETAVRMGFRTHLMKQGDNLDFLLSLS
jgi:putative hydrolase of the HAD superfamily